MLQVQRGNERQPLLAPEDQALRLFALDEIEATEATRDALHTLSRIHRLATLLCDCLPVGEDPPQACAVRLPSGDMTLRWFNGVRHAAACPFFRSTHGQTEHSSSRGGPPPGGRAYKPWKGSWNVLGDRIEGLGSAIPRDAPPPPAKPTQSIALPRLGRVLLSALHRCGYDQVSVRDIVAGKGVEPAQPAWWARRIYKLLDEPVSQRLTFRDTSSLSLRHLNALLSCHLPRHRGAFGKTRPQGIVIDRVHAIETDGKCATLIGIAEDSQSRFSLPCPVRHFGAHSAGPYWVILQITAPSATEPFQVIDAYAHPCFTMDLPIPVDSDPERELLALVLDQMRFWLRYPKTQTATSLIKPLFDMDSPLGPCRPDLIVRAVAAGGHRRHLAIECMGRIDDPDYLAAKRVTHPRMEALPDICAVLDWVPDTIPEPDFRRTMTRTLFHSLRAF